MNVERLAIPAGRHLHPDRDKYLTASDIPAVAGKSPFKSPLRVWNEKQGLVPDQVETPLMRRGRWLEPAAVKGMQERYPDWLITQPGIFLVERQLRLGATPDCFIVRPGDKGTINCQIKTVGPFVFEREWADGPPEWVRIQTATEGLLLGSVTNFVCALVVESHGIDFTLYELPRRPSDEAVILDVVADFWRRVDQQDPYPPDFARDGEIIHSMFPKAEPETVIDLTGDNRLADLLPLRAEKKDLISGLQRDVKTIDTEIEAKLGAIESAIVPGWRITWKNEFVKAHQVPERNSRVLRVKQLKEDAA
jgi:predicted phage-related endonuclease